MSARKAIFLDLFGTLIEDHGVLDKIDDIVFKRGAIEALVAFQDNGFMAFISICRLGMPIPDRSYIENIQEYVSNVLISKGIENDSFHFVSHIDSQRVDLHPLTLNVINQLEDKYNLDLSSCILMGDLMKDIKTGKEAGVKTVLLSSPVDSPSFDNTEWHEPDLIVESLGEAAAHFDQR